MLTVGRRGRGVVEGVYGEVLMPTFEQVYEPVAGGQPGALDAGGRHSYSGAVRAAGRLSGSGTLVIPGVVGHSPRHSGGSVRDAGKSGARLDAYGDRLRTLPYSLDRHKYHVFKLQTPENCAS